MIHHISEARLLKSRRQISPKIMGVIASTRGRVLPPLLLYLLGVPGVIVILLWIFVFRG